MMTFGYKWTITIHILFRILVPSFATETATQIIVIGGGWAGFGTAHALLSELNGRTDSQVIVLEGSPQPGGLASGWRSASGRNVEAGIHGFWRCYKNVERLISTELKLVGENSPFTSWTPSALWTPNGLSVTSPVFSDAIQLPTPLGTALLPTFRNLSPLDMLSAAPLFLPWLDFDGSKESWKRYDKISARDLFSRFGMSSTLYEQFILPLLLVLPMCPGEDCSAAAALSLFSYFALEHQPDFDVKWLRGSATELIFQPWRSKLETMGGIVLNDKKVTRISLDPSNTRIISIETSDGTVFSNISAVISCTGISAAQNIVRSNPPLAAKPDFANILKLKAVDVVAVRLWLNKHVSLPFKSNVGGGGLAVGLDSTGCTFHDVAALQDKVNLSISEANNSVLEVDFYYAQTLVGQDDETVLSQALEVLNNCQQNSDDRSTTRRSANKSSREAAPSAYSISREDVEDFVVVKIPRAVSHFAPGSFSSLPGIETSIDNFFFAGDWIDRSGHQSWSQEKALVTGYQAAEIVLQRMAGEKKSSGGTGDAGSRRRRRGPAVIPVEPSEPHVALGRAVASRVRSRLSKLGSGLSRRL